MADCLRYDLSLLVTLDARDFRTNGFIGPAEAMQRMQKVFMEYGIDPHQVMLRIEPHQVVITDSSSGSDMEYIHLSMIQNPASITSNHVAGFDNIVMFVVVDDSKLAPPELHIFQSLEKAAQELVADLKAAKEGRLFSPNRKTSVSNYNVNRAATDLERGDEYEQQAQRLATATISYRPGPDAGQMFRQALNRDDNLKIDSDITVGKIEALNHCFDDIEKFVGRLQQAANAFRELTRRRKDRQGGPGLGDGMLGMRARPPPANDYVDILQKFKLAFNLLAKLKSHIRNPNAPELIHYLFSPLQLIIDTSIDAASGKPVLASKVYSPLLNADTLILLNNCMTSLETDLLTSLGQAWNVSREDWPGAVPAYYPNFFDDWQPNPAWLEDVGVSTAAAGAAATAAVIHQRNKSDGVTSYQPVGSGYNNGSDSRVYGGRPVTRSQSSASTSVPMRGQAGRNPPVIRASVGYQVSRELRTAETSQEEFLQRLRARGADVCMVRANRAAKTAQELSVKEGDILEVLDSSKNWWKAVNSVGEIGFVPYTFVMRLEHETSGSSSPALSPPNTPRAGAVAPAVTAGSAAAANKYSSLDRKTNGHGHVNATAESLQADHVYQFTKVSPFTGDSPVKHQEFPDEIKPRKLRTPGIRTATDDINDELKQNFMPGIKPRPQRRVDPAMSNMIFINKTSTPEEIREWLMWKGFSDNVQIQLSEHTGRHLFALTRSNCENLFGPEEGSRLYSQVLVQKNKSGFRTPRSAELEAVLKFRKSKVDNSENGYQTNF